METRNKVMAGVGVGILAIAGGLTISATDFKCLLADEELMLNQDQKLCISTQEYKDIKAELKSKYNKNGYDFDINDKPMIEAILNNELKKKPLQIEGMTREKLKAELVKLLQ